MVGLPLQKERRRGCVGSRTQEGVGDGEPPTEETTARQVLARRPRYIEIKENTVLAKYKGEAEKMGSWFAQIRARSIPYQSMYPKRQRCDAAELFWSLAPECIQSA